MSRESSLIALFSIIIAAFLIFWVMDLRDLGVLRLGKSQAGESQINENAVPFTFEGRVLGIENNKIKVRGEIFEDGKYETAERTILVQGVTNFLRLNDKKKLESLPDSVISDRAILDEGSYISVDSFDDPAKIKELKAVIIRILEE